LKHNLSLLGIFMENLEKILKRYDYQVSKQLIAQKPAAPSLARIPLRRLSV